MRVLECLDAHLAAREQLAAHLRGGHLSLAKAKYSMGPGALAGQQAFPQEMTAGAWLAPLPMQQQAAQGASSQPLSESDDEFTEYQLQLSAYPGNPLSREAISDLTTERQSDQDTAVKQQRQQQPHQQQQQQQQQGKRKDPLMYFGAMPPQSLKSAAGDFRAALQLAVEAANLGQQLQRLMQEWEALNS